MKNTNPQKNNGMRGHRTRNASGRLRKKRGDTHVGSIEENYHIDFEVRSDMNLSTLRKRGGETGLKHLIEEEA